jgi:hypothetical protein
MGERLHAFGPDADRVRVLDRFMRRRLAESLRYILRQADGQLDVDQGVAMAFADRLEAQPASPLAFSYYSDAVLAIEDDDLSAASEVLGHLFRLPPAAGDLAIVDIADPERDPAARQFASFINADPSITFDIFPPTPAASAACRGQIDGAFKLLDAADPALAGEIRALLRLIVLAAGNDDPKAYTFDGASSFMLWGAIILNTNRGPDPTGAAVNMVQMLAHESAHNLLFGIGADEALVNNDPADLYSSPLRIDPRPMDGIYHATFVTARMHRAVARLLDSDALSAPERAKARLDLADNARRFGAGYETVTRHGDLSPLGKAVMDGAAAYMASAT